MGIPGRAVFSCLGWGTEMFYVDVQASAPPSHPAKGWRSQHLPGSLEIPVVSAGFAERTPGRSA